MLQRHSLSEVVLRVMGQENNMSENRGGGNVSFSKVVQKHAGRAKEKVSNCSYFLVLCISLADSHPIALTGQIDEVTVRIAQKTEKIRLYSL